MIGSDPRKLPSVLAGSGVLGVARPPLDSRLERSDRTFYPLTTPRVSPPAMKALHARYPFLAVARETVEAADVDLVSIVTRENDPIVERAVDRVTRAIEAGTVGDPHPTPRVELLSYPVARVLVSLVGEPPLIQRYAQSEATTAYERFTADVDESTELQSVSRERLTLRALLREFELEDAVVALESDGGFGIDVARYLALAADLPGDRWRLTNRTLAAGTIPVTRDELYDLLREAVTDRIEDGLPLDVPDTIAEPLAPEVARIRELLADIELSDHIDTVEPDLFPPCVQRLLDRVRNDEPLAPHSRFSLTAFLATIGMETADIVELYADHPDLSEEITRYQLHHLRDETGPAAYAPPSCATMQAYGDCVDMDAVCETIAHPLAYYEKRLDGVDPDDVAERRGESSG